MRHAIQAGNAGTLSKVDARALVDGSAVIRASRQLSALPSDRILPLVRHVYTRSVSWALYTSEYLESLHRLLAAITSKHTSGRAIRVLEVCAGGGVLAALMKARGFVWMATDANPPASASGEVSQRSALAAVQEATEGGSAVDVVFFSWWSRSQPKKKKKRKHEDELPTDTEEPEPRHVDPEDRRVAEHCAAANVPIVFVSEPAGGITGSSELWQGAYTIGLAAGHVADFDDVCNWNGFSDCTWVLLPRATANTAL